MKKNGQAFLVAGIFLLIITVVLSIDFIIETEWTDFVSGLCAGMAIVFVIRGMILLFREKRKKE